MTTRILLDMDGVLVDFNRGMREAHGYAEYSGPMPQPWDTCEWVGMTEAEWWKPADDERFWENLHWTPDGVMVLAQVLKYFEPEQVCLLTSPSLCPESATGKIRWIQREMPTFSRRFLIGPAKQFCAHPDALLIDDNDKNCEHFAAHGGKALRVPRPWNTNWMLDTRSYVSAYLEAYAWGVQSPTYLKQIEEGSVDISRTLAIA